MKKLKNVAQLFLALAITITSIFSNAFVVFADANPNAGKVTATKTAERIGDETSRSAKVKITVSGNPYTITTQKDREIVLVLDSSRSMKDYLVNASKSKLDKLKDAADAFIDSLLVEENKGKIKIGVVWYDTNVTKTCPLSDDVAKLDACLNSEKAADGGTNVQEGIREAKKLFTDKKNEKDLIVLSDGLPTFFTTVKDGVQHTHGTGKTDEHESLSSRGFTSTSDRYELNGNYVRDGYVAYEDRVDGTIYKCEARGYYSKIFDLYEGYKIVGACDAGYMKKPSEAAKEEAETFTGKIYSIGFGVGADSDAEKFLQSIVKNGGRYFDASDSDKLNEAFAAVSKDIEVVAKNLTIRDVVPNTFTVDTEALKAKYGDKVEITTDEKTKETIITYKFDELSSKEPEELEFTVTANDNYYGSMYTNNGATVTGTASDGNKFYENVDGKISEDLIDPVAPIASRTEDNNYDTETNKELVVDAIDGIKSNDYNGKQEDEAKSVLDEIIIVNETKYGSLELNQDGSLKYNPNTNFRGTDGFTYYIKTTITDKNGNKTYAKSDIATVTINVKGVTATYTVNYLEKGTNNHQVAPSKEVSTNANNEDLYIGDKVTEYALPLNNYNLVSNSQESITLAKEGNVINFYYEKLDSAGAIAHHYIIAENGNKTTDKLFKDDVATGKLDDKFSFSAHTDLGDYEFVESEGDISGILTDEVQEAKFYYRLKSAKVIVHHYEEGTTIKVADDETIDGKVSKDYTTKEANVIGYVLVEIPQNATGKFTEEVTEVIYYYKKDMGKVITRYVDEDGKILLDETATNGQVGTDYQTSPATITDYELKNVIGEEKGKYTKEDIIVTYVYEYVMGQGGDDTFVTPEEPEIPYTGIDSENYILEYSLMGTSILGIALLLILKKKFN